MLTKPHPSDTFLSMVGKIRTLEKCPVKGIGSNPTPSAI